MRISDKAVDEFIAIYKEEFKEDITRAEAPEMTSQLVSLYLTLSRRH